MISSYSQPPAPQMERPTFNILNFAIMDRYIFNELILPFCFGVAAFSVIGLAVGTLFDLIHKITESGLPIFTALQIFGLQMPSFFVLALPMSILLATLMVYSRLSGSSEIIALRGCGVSFYRLVLPAIILSLIVAGTTFICNELVVPSANYKASTTLNHALKQDQPTFKEKNIFYREFIGEELSRTFYARRFDGKYMQDLTILNFSPSGLSQIVAANSATWNNHDNAWDFSYGTIYNVSADSSYRNILKFEHQQLRLPRVPLDLATQNRTSEQMNIAQTQKFLQLVELSGDEKQIRKLKVRIQEKYALPSVCIVFGLVGASLGMRPRRTTPSKGFGISIVIIFGYYLFSFISSSLGEAGVLSAFMAGWLPTILGLATGGALLIWTSH